MTMYFTPTLRWRHDGDLTRLIADLPEEDEYLLIDYDEARRGECKWFLTWFEPGNHEGMILQSDVDPEGLKAYARTWVGDDDK